MTKALLVVLVAGTIVAPTATAQARIDVPPEPRYTWADLGKDLKELRANIRQAKALVSWQAECRGYSPEKTVRCAAAKFDTNAAQAVSVWRCESNFGIESSHSDAYHGPFQYMYSTYEHQQEAMPDVVEWNELSPAVHDVRSNILTAVAWAARHGWGPWGCA
jgi:hypothetical protein